MFRISVQSSAEGPKARALRWSTLAVVALFLLPLVAAAGAYAQGGTVTAARTVTTTVDNEAHDNWAVTAPRGQVISVSFSVTSGGNVDVFVFNPQGLSDYENPNVQTFRAEEDRSNTRSFSGQVASNGALMYFVVDNDNITTVGAMSSGPVTYTADFTMAAAPDFTLPALLLLIVIVAVVVVVVMRKKKAAAMPPPGHMPPGQLPPGGMPPPPPPQY